MTVKEVLDRSWHKPLVIGHRGAAASHPENTLPSFEEAIAAGAVGVECDVHVSRDGELVVIHDHTLDRTTSLKGLVQDAGSGVMRAEGVPTLAEYLAITKDRALSVIEIKDGVGVVGKTVELLQTKAMVEQTIVFSFNLGYLQEVKQIEPALFTAWLQSEMPDLEGVGMDGISLAYPAINLDIVTQANRRGMPVFAWTVPPGPDVDRLAKFGVNFLITNHPREVGAQLRDTD